LFFSFMLPNTMSTNYLSIILQSILDIVWLRRAIITMKHKDDRESQNQIRNKVRILNTIDKLIQFFFIVVLCNNIIYTNTF